MTTMPPNSPCTATESQDLKRRITTFLVRRGIPAAQNLEIEVSGGKVTLGGVVATFYERQLCISCCQHVAGVLGLIDNLTVQSPPRTIHRA